MPSKININLDYEQVFLPVYKKLRTTDARLKFLYGGRDSGKSRDRAQQLVLDCLTKTHFLCILIKKTANSIKDSQFTELKKVIISWGLESLFRIKEHPLEITCINGNKFIARGMDDPANIKSISEPSNAWIEEGNQLSMDDWVYVVTTLRGQEPVNIDVTFNPETKGDYQDFWLYREFFSHTTEKSFENTKYMTATVYESGRVIEKEVAIKYIAIHSTYSDNPFVSLERIAWHESLKTLNYYWYRVFTLGDWGNEENNSPWLFAWNRQKHISTKELFATKSQILYLSWDFNRNPQVCTVIQWPQEKKVEIIEVIKVPNVGTEGICEIVIKKYPGFLYMVTGDYSGDTATSLYKEHITNYTVIKRMLRLNDGQIKISPNPRLEKNQTLVNTIFHQYPVQVCPVKAKSFIYDAENVRKRADGTIVKDNRDDPAQQADVLDTGRYWFNQFMGWFIK